jgi:hypothetical protein
MTRGRILSQHEVFVVENMREQARIKAEILWLGDQRWRSNRTPLTLRRIADLQAELATLQEALDLHNRQKQVRA